VCDENAQPSPITSHGTLIGRLRRLSQAKRGDLKLEKAYKSLRGDLRLEKVLKPRKVMFRHLWECHTFQIAYVRW